MVPSAIPPSELFSCFTSVDLKKNIRTHSFWKALTSIDQQQRRQSSGPLPSHYSVDAIQHSFPSFALPSQQACRRSSPISLPLHRMVRKPRRKAQHQRQVSRRLKSRDDSRSPIVSSSLRLRQHRHLRSSSRKHQQATMQPLKRLSATLHHTMTLPRPASLARMRPILIPQRPRLLGRRRGEAHPEPHDLLHSVTPQSFRPWTRQIRGSA